MRVEGGVIQPLSAPTTITGTAQDDNLVAGIYGNAIFGLKGNDTLFGGASDDFLYGGAGDDVLFGGTGGQRHDRG